MSNLFLAITADASSNSFEWALFIGQKYWKMFLDGTKLTIIIALVGTLLGFVLGFLIGIIQNMEIRSQDHFFKKVAVRLLKTIAWIYVEVFRGKIGRAHV